MKRFLMVCVLLQVPHAFSAPGSDKAERGRQEAIHQFPGFIAEIERNIAAINQEYQARETEVGQAVRLKRHQELRLEERLNRLRGIRDALIRERAVLAQQQP
jgi:hypothetical protein